MRTLLFGQQVENHGTLLRKLVRRKKLTQNQAAEQLNISRTTLNKLFNLQEIDEITREEIEKIFQVPPSYFPTQLLAAPTAPPTPPPGDSSCWQLLAEARQEIINLQRQIIEMSKLNINAPKRTQQPA